MRLIATYFAEFATHKKGDLCDVSRSKKYWNMLGKLCVPCPTISSEIVEFVTHKRSDACLQCQEVQDKEDRK